MLDGEREGGTGTGAASELFPCPLSGDFDHKQCAKTAVSVRPREGYFIRFDVFSYPKGQEFDQKTAKKVKCRTYARTLPPPLRPNIDTCMKKQTRGLGKFLQKRKSRHEITPLIWSH